jgi:hypothetical protein
MNKYTYIGHSSQSLFVHEAFCKIHYPSPLLFHQESAIEKYQCSSYNGNMYVCIYIYIYIYIYV